MKSKVQDAEWSTVADADSGSIIRTRRATPDELSQMGAASPMVFIPGKGFERTVRADSSSNDIGFGGLPLNPSLQTYLGRDMSTAAFAEQGYKRNSLVFGLINLRAVAIQQAPIELADRKSPDTVIEDCPLLDLFNNPNPLFDFKKLLCYTETYGCVGGDAYWHKVRNKYGVVEQIYVYHASQMMPIVGPHSWVDHYLYDNGAGFRLEIPVDDIVHFGWSSVDFQKPGRSISPLAALASEIDVDNERKFMELALLQNGAVPAVMIEMGPPTPGSQPPTQAQLDILGQKFELRFGGKNRGKGMIAPSGTKAHILGFSPKDMTTTIFAQIPETRACFEYGVPIQMTSLLNADKSKTYANYSESRTSFYGDTMVPRWDSFASAISHSFRAEIFKGDSRSYIARFDTSKVSALQETENDRIERANDEFTGGTATLNEAREVAGRDPDPTNGHLYEWQLTGGSLGNVGETDPDVAKDMQSEQDARLREAATNSGGRIKVIE